MSLEAAITAAKTHVAAAGAALSPAINRTRRGPPATAPTTAMLAIWYEGPGDAEPTLGKTNYRERLMIAGFWPLSDDSDSLAELADKQITAVLPDILDRLWGDTDLGGNAINFHPGSGEVGFAEFGNAVMRSFQLPVEYEFAETGNVAL